jgi:hypothetical protein
VADRTVPVRREIVPVPTLMPLRDPAASMIAARVPTMVISLLFTRTDSRYVPAGTRIVSPGCAASTAAWIVVLTTIVLPATAEAGNATAANPSTASTRVALVAATLVCMDTSLGGPANPHAG